MTDPGRIASPPAIASAATPAAPDAGARFVRQIGAQAERKRRARRRGAPAVWFGLGMMGLVGWSVVVPTLLGTALGLWLDKHHAGRHGWTLALLAAGLAIGCWNAWRWVAKEDRAMRQAGEDA